VPLQELDWIICNGGADVWHLLPERDGKEATWVADEQWEGHISFRCPSKISPSAHPGRPQHERQRFL
jgi:hypothetical protein